MTDTSLIKPGTVVETAFGVGVIISHRGLDSTAPIVEVRLWRTPGHSIGTSTSAYLHPSAVSQAANMVDTLFSLCFVCL